MANSNVVEINGSNWDSEVLKSKVPVIVDFWAEFCAPCKVLGPILDAVAEEQGGRIKVAKVDCEKNVDLAASMGIRNIPAVFLYVDGIKVKKSTGAMNRASVLKFLEGV